MSTFSNADSAAVNQPFTRRDPLIGRTVGRYRLAEKIGAGGMGAVYLAHHTEISDLTVAIKLLAQNCLDNESLRQRFRDEAAICARLGERSLHIVQIRDYGILDDLDQPYYAMELLLGRSLAEVLHPGSPHLCLEQTISISRQLCAGLQVAHEAGVVHRDLKPGNIFLIPDSQFGERVKVLDFGIAKFLNEASKADSEPLTQGYIGTPHYSSPEQLSGRAVDCRSDLYSLGVILYELLCGESPFAVADESFSSWYHAHQQTPPRSMAAANPAVAVPPEVETVVQQCLAKNPQMRPVDAGEVGLRLENALRRSNENRRREEGQRLLEQATTLGAEARWAEANLLIGGIAYDSPVFSEAQHLLKTWQIEAECRRLEEVRRTAADGEAVGPVRASLPRAATVFEDESVFQPQTLPLEGPAPPRTAFLPWLIGTSAVFAAAVFGLFALIPPTGDVLKPVRDSIAQARQAADAERWPTVFAHLEKVSAPSGSAEAIQVKALLDRATSGQLALIKARVAKQQWKEGYDMTRLLLDHAPDGIEAGKARKLLAEISDRWGAELLQGALSNGNLGRLQDDKILLRQAIETARQVPPESGRYALAQRYIKEWEDALKTL